ncbi:MULTISPECIES: RibD family protein [unclassified Streptomyces]|uniref:RibD family protein n=1 Tax=unclassified Streptomyces TaxID=2593676 RepID=UPI00380A116E
MTRREPGHRTDDVLDASTAWELLRTIRTESDAEAAGLILGPSGAPGGDLRAGPRWRNGTPAADALADRYLPLCLAGPRFAFAQLGQSLDGFIATRTGDADYVTGEEDRDHLHRLRALADAVLVGAGTAVSDDPQLTVRACTGAHPVRVILDPHRRVPPGARVFTDGSAPTLWVVGAPDERGQSTPDPVGVDVLTLTDPAAFAPRRLLRELAGRGLGRVLVEGGGITVSRFLHERALHRLYVTVAPVLLGDGVPGLRFDGPDVMREALRPPTRRVTLGEDTLFELTLAPGPGGSAQPGDPLDGEHPGPGQARGEGQ